MPREPIPFSTRDVSALAKSLRAQLASRPTLPTHVEMLNILARATGHQNYQHLRARCDRPGQRDVITVTSSAPMTPDIVVRAARYFDDHGRLQSWPAHRSVQDLCLWMIWAKIPPRQTFSEREISAVLLKRHLFGDPATIRRQMCHTGLMTRTIDGRDYCRIEQAPPPDAAALIRHLRERTRRSRVPVPGGSRAGGEAAEAAKLCASPFE